MNRCTEKTAHTHTHICVAYMLSWQGGQWEGMRKQGRLASNLNLLRLWTERVVGWLTWPWKTFNRSGQNEARWQIEWVRERNVSVCVCGCLSTVGQSSQRAVWGLIRGFRVKITKRFGLRYGGRDCIMSTSVPEDIVRPTSSVWLAEVKSRATKLAEICVLPEYISTGYFKMKSGAGENCKTKS